MFLFLLFLFPTLVAAFIESSDVPFLAEEGLNLLFKFKYYFSFIFLNTLPYFYLFRIVSGNKILTGVSFIRYVYVFLFLFSFILTGHLPNTSVLLSVFDTNFKEAVEFFVTLPLKFWVVSVLYWTVFAVLLKKSVPNPVKERKDILFSAACFILFSGADVAIGTENSFFGHAVESYGTYRRIKEISSGFDTSSADGQIRITDADPSLNRTIVVMIGESETAEVFNEHLPLFFKLLGENRKNLILVPEAETNATQTIVVLKSIFMHPVRNSPEKSFNLLRLFGKAGYKTFWLSNHFKQGKDCDDFLYAMTSPVSYRKYYNYYDFGNIFDYNGDSHDEILLDGLKEALADPAGKKIIFLHLFGEHNLAENRYPDGFHSPLVEPKEKKKYSANEHYKNAAAYTNTVLAKAIGMLKERREPTAAVYFSDHGDDPVMPFVRIYERIKNVPLFFWLSEDYQKHFPNLFRSLSCIRHLYFADLPFVLNRTVGVDVADLPVSEEIKACFEKEN